MSYDKYHERLENQYGKLHIRVVKHDASFFGLPLYVEVELGATPKDKGETALDLGNYLYHKYGIAYEPIPEYRGSDKKTTIRWFVSWDRGVNLVKSILEHYGKTGKVYQDHYLPVEFYSLPLNKIPKRRKKVTK
jgi:hypothetical protein